MRILSQITDPDLDADCICGLQIGMQNFETFHEILAKFDLKKRSLIKIEAMLMEF